MPRKKALGEKCVYLHSQAKSYVYQQMVNGKVFYINMHTQDLDTAIKLAAEIRKLPLKVLSRTVITKEGVITTVPKNNSDARMQNICRSKNGLYMFQKTIDKKTFHQSLETKDVNIAMERADIIRKTIIKERAKAFGQTGVAPDSKPFVPKKMNLADDIDRVAAAGGRIPVQLPEPQKLGASMGSSVAPGAVGRNSGDSEMYKLMVLREFCRVFNINIPGFNS